MDENTELEGQDGQEPEEGNDNQPENDKGGAEDATPKVKIGENEYTPEELAQFIEKGKNYDKLLPDYTQKSQKLAEIEKSNKINKSEQEDDVPEFAKEGWEPKSYSELQKAILWAKESGKQEALKTLEAQKEEVDKKKAEVDNFFSEVKKTDKDFDEKDFSEFVLKHTKDKDDVDIKDIKSFYSVYKDFGEARKIGEDAARKNKDSRTEKVNSAGGEGGSGVDFSDLRGKGNLIDIARNALDRIKK